jgi:DNA-binding NtrC family response regulator
MAQAPTKRPYDRTSFILVVDDDNTLLKFFKIHLNKFFSKVLVVENGKQAIDTLKEKTIDLIVSDIRMPRADGFQVLTKARRMDPTIPFLLISGELLNDEQKDLLQQSDGFLAKPFTIDQLNDFINQGMALRDKLNEICKLIKDPHKIRDLIAEPSKADRMAIAKEHAPEIKKMLAAIQPVQPLKSAG